MITTFSSTLLYEHRKKIKLKVTDCANKPQLQRQINRLIINNYMDGPKNHTQTSLKTTAMLAWCTIHIARDVLFVRQMDKQIKIIHVNNLLAVVNNGACLWAQQQRLEWSSKSQTLSLNTVITAYFYY